MRNIIPEFTKLEQNYIKDNANFTERELKLFELRNKEYSYERCAEEMDMGLSTVKKISKKMIDKISKVIKNMEI